MDPLSIAVAALTIIQSISAAYETFKDLKGLPKAFNEVGRNLPLAQDTLELARSQLQIPSIDGDTRTAIANVLKDCEEKAKSLNDIFQELDRVRKNDKGAKDWSALVNFYRMTMLKLGKSNRVETLMQEILQGLKGLAIHQIFQVDYRSQIEKIDSAIERLSEVEPSLQDSEFERRGTNVNQHIAEGGKGNQFFNESGSMTNEFGNRFNATGNMSFAFNVHPDSNGYRGLATPQCVERLSPFCFESAQIDALNRATSPSEDGKWFLSSKQFLNWRDEELKKLWCHGIPGVGKTILSLSDRQSLKSILSGLLIQLLQKDRGICVPIEQSLANGHVFVNDEQLLELVIGSFKKFRKVYLVIDALDECSDPHGFLKACEKMPAQVHTLFMSRPGYHLKSTFNPHAELEIVADADDMRRYLQKVLSKRSQLERMINLEEKRNSGFKEKIQEIVVKKSQGMFLLTALHMEFLASSYDIRQFKHDLSTLSKTPDGVYEVSLQRIRMQDDRSQSRALNVLAWLAFAKRALTTIELAHAISIWNSLGHIQAGECNLPTISDTSNIHDIIAPCVGLVVVDKEKRLIRLAHKTAEQYLRREASIKKLAVDNIVQVCLACLNYTAVDCVGKVTDVKMRSAKMQETYPLYIYAATYWGQHMIRGVPGSVQKLAWSFLSNRSLPSIMTLCMGDLEIHGEGDMSGLHVAAYFGLSDLVKKAVSKQRNMMLDAKTTWGRTPLHWAVMVRQRAFLELLVSRGADPKIYDRHGKTALHMAIAARDIESVKILLTSEMSFDFQHADGEKWTPLRLAAASGQVEIATVLLQKGAEIDAEDQDGWTALRWAAQKGQITMVSTLLEQKASPEPRSEKCDDSLWNLLRWAAQEGREKIIKLLIDMRVNMHAHDSRGCTALHLAARYSRMMTAWLLIQAGADINKANDRGLTPFHEAINANNSSLVYLFSENGADLEAETKHGRTPIHEAASEGSSSIVWFLLEKNVRWAHQDGQNRTALHTAVEKGRVDVIRTLLQKSKDLIDMRDFEDRTAIHVAATSGQVGIIELLLRNGASVNAQDSKGRTALHLGVRQGLREVVQCLMRYKADTSIISKEKPKQTAIQLAKSLGDHSIVAAISTGIIHCTPSDKEEDEDDGEDEEDQIRSR